MNRFALGVFVVGVAALAMGFTSIQPWSTPQRLRWDTVSSPTVAQRGVPFANSFTAYKTVAGTAAYGFASYRMAGVECTVYGVGATDGGTNSLLIDVIHEDAGVDCECNLGSAACAGAQYFSCDCAGFVQLQGARWQVQPAASSTCQTMPGNINCSIDLFR